MVTHARVTVHITLPEGFRVARLPSHLWLTQLGTPSTFSIPEERRMLFPPLAPLWTPGRCCFWFFEYLGDLGPNMRSGCASACSNQSWCVCTKSGHRPRSVYSLVWQGAKHIVLDMFGFFFCPEVQGWTIHRHCKRNCYTSKFSMNFGNFRFSRFPIGKPKIGASIASVVNLCTHLWTHHSDLVLGTTT